jgi:hypothetical protein
MQRETSKVLFTTKPHFEIKRDCGANRVLFRVQTHSTTTAFVSHCIAYIHICIFGVDLERLLCRLSVPEKLLELFTVGPFCVFVVFFKKFNCGFLDDSPK